MDASLHKPALEALRAQIRSSAVSLTSIPKALKFLRHQFDTLASIYEHMPRTEDKRFLADIISVIAMTRFTGSAGTSSDTASPSNTLKYYLLGQNSTASLGDWGHEYVRHLAMELMAEYPSASGADADAGTPAFTASTLTLLAMQIAAFFLDHNGEPDACDLLYEIGQLEAIIPMASQDGHDHTRICLYLLSCVPYEAGGDDRTALRVAYQIYRAVNDCPHALILALRLGEPTLIHETFTACPDPLTKKQLAYILARHQYRLPPEIIAAGAAVEDQGHIQEILNNTRLTDSFKMLAKELEIVDPKTPDDIYKSHLQDALRVPPAPSPRQNLAAAFVNGFVNAGFGSDRLLTGPEVEADESRSWIYRVKDHGILSTVASLGLLHLWDADVGLGALDRYLYSENGHIKAGAVLGIGLVHVGSRNESDPALALLREYLEASEPDAAGQDGGAPSSTTAANTLASAPAQQFLLKETALMGLALAYGGSARRDVAETIIPLVSHKVLPIATMAALALGHIFVGTGDGDLASVILQAMMEREAASSAGLDGSQARFFALALALLYLGRSEAEAQVVLDTLEAIEHGLARDAAVLVKICSYAGSGNVLQIQELLKLCIKQEPPKGEPEEKSGEESSGEEGQAYAVLGVALICMMEDIGREMSHRLFTHLMHYGSLAVRKAVPLALGLLYASHPAPAVLDMLSKWSHDAEKAVAVAAVLGLGIVAAGSNNAKVAQMLRQLAAYYQRDADCLYVVRIAQGLVHAAKGTVTVSPVHSHRLLLSPVALSGLLAVMVAALDAQSLLLERGSYLLYFLVAAIYPRFLVALDGESKDGGAVLPAKPLLVRVGQAVDVVGQAGKPKTITGFQTHSTPVLLAHGERAELASEEYLALSPILENFVIVRRNPNWVE